MNIINNNEFAFEIVEEDVKEVAKVKESKKPRIAKDNTQDYEFVLPEIIEFDEIDECLIFPKKGKKFIPSFNSYDDRNEIRYYNNEKDWDLLRSLVLMKVARKNKKQQKVVLDDIVEFRLLPKQWSEELCDYLFRNNFDFIVYEENNRW